jgi:hypothetical protein
MRIRMRFDIDGVEDTIIFRCKLKNSQPHLIKRSKSQFSKAEEIGFFYI